MLSGKYLLIIAIGIFTCKEANCQLSVFQDDDAIITPNFNKDLIHSKKISKIVMHYFIKPDGGFITDDNNDQQFFFDSTGTMFQSKYTIKTDNGIDTISCNYYYDAPGNVVIKRTEMGSFFDTWYYNWNSNNQVKKEIHVHELRNATADGKSKMITQTIISADSFAYISSPGQLQQYEYNEDNKYFRKAFTQLDSTGRIISRDCQYAVGTLYSHLDIKYSASGKITEYANTGNINRETSQTVALQYDSLGKVYEEGVTINGKQKHKIEFMYSENGLISNKLDRDNDKSLITIIRFGYEMYGDIRDTTTGK